MFDDICTSEFAAVMNSRLATPSATSVIAEAELVGHDRAERLQTPPERAHQNHGAQPHAGAPGREQARR